MQNALRLSLILILVCCSFARGEDRFFDSAGVRIRYLDRGSGEAVVLIHGFSQNVERAWQEPGLLDALAQRYRVIALDCRGHGKSEKPHERDAYGSKMVDDVVRLLDHLDLERAHLVGYSMGGRIALKLATTHPDRARSVVLIGAGGARASDDHTLVDDLADALARGEGIRPLMLHLFPPDLPDRPSDEQLEAINQQVLAANDARALELVARRYRDLATSDEQLAAVRGRVVAVIGEYDSLLPEVQRLKQRMPALEVVQIDGANHVSVLTSPTCLREIERAIERRDEPSR